MTSGERWFLYKHDCAAFSQKFLGLNVSEPRIERFLNTDAAEIIALFSRQVGKTTGAAAKATHGGMFKPGVDKDAPWLALIVSATQRQGGILQKRVEHNFRMLSRGESWKEIPNREAEVPEYIGEGANLVRCSSMSLELENGAEVISAPASPDTVRGYSPNLIIMDEAAFSSDDVYQAVRPMRIRTKAQLVLMSSAGFQQGFFFDAWTKGEDWLKIEIKADECSWVTAEELDKERRNLPLRVFQREYENRFMEREGAALSAEVISDMFSNEVEALMEMQEGHALTKSDDVEAL
jgi:hypothetical protein